MIQQKKLQLPSVHAVVVGSDLTTQSKFELELRNFVQLKKLQNYVHFVNKTLTVAPYLAAIDVLVQNSQVSGPPVLHLDGLSNSDYNAAVFSAPLDFFYSNFTYA